MKHPAAESVPVIPQKEDDFYLNYSHGDSGFARVLLLAETDAYSNLLARESGNCGLKFSSLSKDKIGRKEPDRLNTNYHT